MVDWEWHLCARCGEPTCNNQEEITGKFKLDCIAELREKGWSYARRNDEEHVFCPEHRSHSRRRADGDAHEEAQEDDTGTDDAGPGI